MSVLIKEMEMPKSCACCDIACRYYLDHGLDGLLAKICRAESRLPDCPLVPVPPHGRLIDADALHEELYGLEYARENEWLDGVREARGVDAARVALLDAPTIIEAEEGE